MAEEIKMMNELKMFFRRNVDTKTVTGVVVGGAVLGGIITAAKKFGPKPVKKIAKAANGEV